MKQSEKMANCIPMLILILKMTLNRILHTSQPMINGKMYLPINEKDWTTRRNAIIAKVSKTKKRIIKMMGKKRHPMHFWTSKPGSETCPSFCSVNMLSSAGCACSFSSGFSWVMVGKYSKEVDWYGLNCNCHYINQSRPGEGCFWLLVLASADVMVEREPTFQQRLLNFFSGSPEKPMSLSDNWKRVKQWRGKIGEIMNRINTWFFLIPCFLFYFNNELDAASTYFDLFHPPFYIDSSRGILLMIDRQ